MDRIKSLLSSGTGLLLTHWQKLVLLAVAAWMFSTIMSIGERIGTLTEITKKNGDEMVAIRGQLSDLKQVSDQMLQITQAQMALTQKLDDDYAKWKNHNQEVTDQRVTGVTTGTLRMSVRKPANAAHPVPYPANAGR